MIVIIIKHLPKAQKRCSVVSMKRCVCVCVCVTPFITVTVMIGVILLLTAFIWYVTVITFHLQ